ncbi:hypothetical protein [Leptospira borgpetersenii]|uniref:hypothetical protein n=1 Tax=Leptospira borgpetersenii TaxID=174 RepID=UPI000AF4D5ED|nr:hypothetical protein [Leptospira borgpetersenii]
MNSYLAYRYLSRPTNTTFQISEQTFVYESAHIITWGISISQTKIQRNGTAYEPNSDVERFYYNARLMGLQLTDYASQINQKVTVVDGLITELKLGIRGSNSLYSNRNESGTFPNLYLTAGGDRASVGSESTSDGVFNREQLISTFYVLVVIIREKS